MARACVLKENKLFPEHCANVCSFFIFCCFSNRTGFETTRLFVIKALEQRSLPNNANNVKAYSLLTIRCTKFLSW